MPCYTALLIITVHIYILYKTEGSSFIRLYGTYIYILYKTEGSLLIITVHIYIMYKTEGSSFIRLYGTHIYIVQDWGIFIYQTLSEIIKVKKITCFNLKNKNLKKFPKVKFFNAGVFSKFQKKQVIKFYFLQKWKSQKIRSYKSFPH